MNKTMVFALAGIVLMQFAPVLRAQNTSMTIYNQDFAVIRDKATLDLKEGENVIGFSEIAATLEPQSVILRDPKGEAKLQILDQSFRNDPVTQQYLLSLFEGKTIQFQAIRPDGKIELIDGKIIRSGYMAPQRPNPYGRMNSAMYESGQPVIEVAGKLQFALPGMPLFPSLEEDTILKPTLNWTLKSSKAGKVDAEIGYLATGLSWQADYNVVSPEKGDECDIVGWVTFQNQSGKTFRDAKVNLMAGDVSRVQENRRDFDGRIINAGALRVSEGEKSGVTQKDFDDFKLYTLPRPVTLRNQEMKQVEFVKATNVKAPRFYVYDGVMPEYGSFAWWLNGGLSTEPNYGTPTNKKVWIFREFENKEDNGLGIPLPKGKLRFYRRDTGRFPAIHR